MGRIAAHDMAQHAPNLRTALSWHLQHNHYPPVPLSMLDTCEQAIAHAELDQWNVNVELPPGVTYKGSTVAPVWAVVEQHHLSDFITEENPDE